jgi:phosphatidylserine decarboxylase
MKIAPEGLPFVAGFAALAAIPGVLAGWASGGPGWAAGIAAAPGLLLTLFSAWFFRDPEREIPEGQDLVVSPADGRVVAVTNDPAGPELAIFLNVFDVHVNRAPVKGTVESVRYTEGSFLVAYDDRAGEVNERNEIVIAADAGPVRVTQIAGAIARRIVCRVRPGDRVSAGQRVGLIRFGSRTDLRLPPGATIAVRVGDRVKGGESVVGRLAAVPAASRIAKPDLHQAERVRA